MAIVNCPACQKKLKVADTSLGKKVKCTCGHVFVAAADASVVAEAETDKVIVACTECGSSLKVATAFLGKKMKCPKCAAIFVASAEAPNPVPAAPAVAAPVPASVEDDDLMAFAQADVDVEDDAPQPKKGKTPPMLEDEDDDVPAPKSKRSVPAKTEAPKKYPGRILVSLFTFFMLSLFIAFFAAVFLMMEEKSMIEENITNRKYLEGFGWPAKPTRAKNQGPNDGGGMPGKGMRKGRKFDNEKDRVIAGDQDNAVDGESRKGKDADPRIKGEATKDERRGAANPAWRRAVATMECDPHARLRRSG